MWFFKCCTYCNVNATCIVNSPWQKVKKKCQIKLKKMSNEHEKFDWPKEAILEMIGLWQTYECLYNPKNKFYHNKHSRYAAFNAIAEKLKAFNESVGPTDIKNKMQYLRGQFTRELSKSKDIKSGASADDIYVPTAYWFKELSFLNDFVKIRKGNCNLFEQNSSQLEDSCESSQFLESDVSPAQPSKRSRVENNTPVSSRSMNQEDAVLEAAVIALQGVSNAKKTSVNGKDEAFCNFIKSELNAITNGSIKDELVEKITLAVFEAKKKQRMKTNTTENFSDFSTML